MKVVERQTNSNKDRKQGKTFNGGGFVFKRELTNYELYLTKKRKRN